MEYKCCPACSGDPQKKQVIVRSQVFFICSRCKTQWLVNGPQFNEYDSKYIEERGYSSPAINVAKERTFRNFWGKLGKLSGPILEIGCGTGISLKVAQDMGLDVYGLEVNESIFEFTEQFGISRNRVSIDGLKKFSNKKFQAVVFFDSFEHLPNAGIFLSELTVYLADGAILLFVLPIGDSISIKLLKNYWPHYEVDHCIHYTLKGLEILFQKYNIEIIKKFYPAKYLPIELLLRLASLKWKLFSILKETKAFKLISSITLYFSIGEIGIISKYKG